LYFFEAVPSLYKQQCLSKEEAKAKPIVAKSKNQEPDQTPSQKIEIRLNQLLPTSSEESED
jgi:hypothetical protein